MAKSTAMPTNSTPNPTDTRFRVPTATDAKNRVIIRPRPSVIKIGTISRQDRTARNSQREISRTLPIRPQTAPWATVANSSSARATWPVMRTRATPDCTKSSCAITARIACVAAPPGSSDPKSCFGCTSTNLYLPARSDSPPPSSFCQDSGRGWPASTSAMD